MCTYTCNAERRKKMQRFSLQILRCWFSAYGCSYIFRSMRKIYFIHMYICIPTPRMTWVQLTGVDMQICMYAIQSNSIAAFSGAIWSSMSHNQLFFSKYICTSVSTSPTFQMKSKWNANQCMTKKHFNHFIRLYAIVIYNSIYIICILVFSLFE